MKPFAASPVNVNTVQISAKEPICIIRQLNRSVQPLNPCQFFEGIYLHFPLEMIQIYNKDMSLALNTFFINCSGINKWFIAPREAKIVTFCLPWEWLSHHFSYNEYLILRKKSHLDLILTAVNTSHPNINGIFSDFQAQAIGYPKIPHLKSLEKLLSTVFEGIFSIDLPKRNKKARLAPIDESNKLGDIYTGNIHNGITDIHTMNETDKIKVVFDKYVNNPRGRMPGLTKIAKEINMPLIQLKNMFKKLYGKPIQIYHIEIKFKYGMELLEKGYKVCDVSKALCYTQPAKFVSTFKKIYNITPGQITKHTKYI